MELLHFADKYKLTKLLTNCIKINSSRIHAITAEEEKLYMELTSKTKLELK